jgi:hypothetical protein
MQLTTSELILCGAILILAFLCIGLYAQMKREERRADSYLNASKRGGEYIDTRRGRK